MKIDSGIIMSALAGIGIGATFPLDQTIVLCAIVAMIFARLDS